MCRPGYHQNCFHGKSLICTPDIQLGIVRRIALLMSHIEILHPILKRAVSVRYKMYNVQTASHVQTNYFLTMKY